MAHEAFEEQVLRTSLHHVRLQNSLHTVPHAGMRPLLPPDRCTRGPDASILVRDLIRKDIDERVEGLDGRGWDRAAPRVDLDVGIRTRPTPRRRTFLPPLEAGTRSQATNRSTASRSRSRSAFQARRTAGSSRRMASIRVYEGFRAVAPGVAASTSSRSLSRSSGATFRVVAQKKVKKTRQVRPRCVERRSPGRESFQEVACEPRQAATKSRPWTWRSSPLTCPLRKCRSY